MIIISYHTRTRARVRTYRSSPHVIVINIFVVIVLFTSPVVRAARRLQVSRFPVERRLLCAASRPQSLSPSPPPPVCETRRCPTPAAALVSYRLLCREPQTTVPVLAVSKIPGECRPHVAVPPPPPDRRYCDRVKVLRFCRRRFRTHFDPDGAPTNIAY